MPLSSKLDLEELKRKLEALPEDFTKEQFSEVIQSWTMPFLTDRIADQMISMLPDAEHFHDGGVLSGQPSQTLNNDYVVTKEQYKRMAKYNLDKDLYLD